MENENKNISPSVPSWIWVFITLSVPILYVIGYFYFLGYLRRFGLTNEFFPSSIEDYMIVAFMSFFELSKNILGGMSVLLVVIIFLIAILYVIGYMTLDKWMERKITKIKESKRFNFLLLPLLAGFSCLSIGGLLLIVLLTFTLVPNTAFYGGNVIASKQIQEFKPCNEKNYHCVYLYSENVLEERGLLIGRSQTHIAIYNGKESRVLPLKGREVRTNVMPPVNTMTNSKQ